MTSRPLNGLRSSYGNGRYVAAEGDVLIGGVGSFNGSGRPGLIYCHGGGGSAANTMIADGEWSMLRGLARYFTVVCADLGGTFTWANPTSITRVGQAKTYLHTKGVPAGPVALFGVSMGAAIALAYALANPADVTAVACSIPLLDIEDVRANNRGGHAASINAAYGGAYSDATHGPVHNPVVFATDLDADLPVALWTASNDDVCIPATATAFVAARPQTERTDVGALGHAPASMDAALDAVPAWVLAEHLAAVA